MIANKIHGRVVIVSSAAGIFGSAGASQYTPTKFALRGMMILKLGYNLITILR